ncbi:neutrophil gelatinase-associated lipocalin isoform X1 [Equus przewalskii]|uniref:Neutrophil gelatinase-associated lipocalin isoform X1 n=1 Tax=Equus przewalskii TaxID=9798 RepID=A0ABM4MIY9_EQUPR
MGGALGPPAPALRSGPAVSRTLPPFPRRVPSSACTFRPAPALRPVLFHRPRPLRRPSPQCGAPTGTWACRWRRARKARTTASGSSRSASFLGPEIMALGLLWLGFTLLGALQTQARDPAPKLIPAPPLDRVPLQPDFKDDQFQGKWYVVGVAGNAFKKEEQGQFTMYTTTYELKEDHSYNVTSILLRDQNCDHWIRTFIPSSQPGQFNLGDIKRYFGVQSYIVRVADTDYNQFAIVFFRKVYKNQEYFKTTLYRRTKELTPELREKFISFAKSLGLTDDHIIFPVPIDQCIDEE